MTKYIINYTNKPALYTDADYFIHAYDSQLKALGIVSIERWSPALGDYVEARRVF